MGDQPGFEEWEDAGADWVHRLADFCKPESLVANAVSFEDAVQLIRPAQRERLSVVPVDPSRLVRLQMYRFSMMPIPTSALRLWPGAGGLPADWTDSYTVHELAVLLDHHDAEVPPGAARLQRILKAAREDANSLQRIRTIPPIAVPEFHGDVRGARIDAPWTLDDGSHRALVRAMVGHDEVIYCLAGSRMGEPDATVTEIATTLGGGVAEDHKSITALLATAAGGYGIARAGRGPEASARALSVLPPLFPPDASRSAAPVVLGRVELRRHHVVRARSAGLFRATDNSGRVLTTAVAQAEYIRTRRAGAFASSPGAASPPDHDRALIAAGKIAHAALAIGGADAEAELTRVGDAEPLTLDVVSAIAQGQGIDPSDHLCRAALDLVPAAPEMARVANEASAWSWQSRHLARAFIVGADAEEAKSDWERVERHAACALLLMVWNVFVGRPEYSDLLCCARALNRLGVSHRARGSEGRGRIDRAALHHEAAIRVLSMLPVPNTPVQRNEMLLVWLTSLTNLASAWNEQNSLAGQHDRESTTDEGHLRAAQFLRAIHDGDRADRIPAHNIMHPGSTSGRPCAVTGVVECLPAEVVKALSGKTPGQRRWWKWVLSNDIAEMVWCAGRHRVEGGIASGWSPRPEGSRKDSVRELLREALLGHIRALDNIHDNDDDLSRTVAGFWRWQHLVNLYYKRDQIAKFTKPLRIGDNPPCTVLQLGDVAAGLERHHRPSRVFMGHQLSTLDANHEQDHLPDWFTHSH